MLGTKQALVGPAQDCGPAWASGGHRSQRVPPPGGFVGANNTHLLLGQHYPPTAVLFFQITAEASSCQLGLQFFFVFFGIFGFAYVLYIIFGVSCFAHVLV